MRSQGKSQRRTGQRRGDEREVSRRWQERELQGEVMRTRNVRTEGSSGSTAGTEGGQGEVDTGAEAHLGML